MNLKVIIYLIFFLFNAHIVFAQQLTMLDNLLSYTSKNDFVAHNMFNVVGHNFSNDGSIDLLLEGDIKSYDYSVALISMLPAFKKTPRKASLYLKYSNLNQENLTEALLIEAISVLYPNKLVDYLLTRAECLFEIDGMQVATSMNMDAKKISSVIDDASYQENVKRLFLVESKSNERVVLNDIEFELIPPFYLDSGEPSLFQVNPDSCNWDYFELSHFLYGLIQFSLKNNYLLEGDFEKHELVHSQKDIYVFLIACTVTNNPSFPTRIDNILHPKKKLDNMVYECGYCNLDKYHNIGYLASLCQKKPCNYFNRLLEDNLNEMSK